MTDYVAPTKDMNFLLEEVIGLDHICELPGYGEVSPDVIKAVLEEGARFSGDVLDPINQSGDREGVHLAGDVVHSALGFKQAYAKFCESGWVSVANDEQWGGQGLPRVLSGQLSEMWNAACMSFCLCPMLSAGVVHALSRHGTDQQKSTYLPNLVSGRWTGTMQLTEPQAGSDLSGVRTSAVKKGEHYLITGSKIYITWGEHDMTDNIIHLVLARTPDAPPGVKGISLFIVPKFLVNADGSLGERNDVKCVSIEKKLGIHASPTCVMAFGDNGGARGFLVGEENFGLQYMFTMMNFARLEVGIEGLAIADRSYQRAANYAKQRTQGKSLDNPKIGDKVAIIDHPDVRRMLMTMKSQVEAMRALCTLACAHLDHALLNPDKDKKDFHQAMFDLLTPVVKGWCTEQSVEIASIGIQVHGGMGFIEETGAAQYLRDARITPIYEGTTGIQANDLIGRKISYEGGRTINILLKEMASFLTDLNNHTDEKSIASIASEFSQALDSLKESVDWLVTTFPLDKRKAFAGSVSFLKLMGIVSGGWLSAKSALSAHKILSEDKGDEEFLSAKIVTAQYYAEHILPTSHVLKKEIIIGSGSILALANSQF
ncbi:MAG: acyl-CoA dehydrogenase [Proteobacteria bacterium]|nr:acyl-CoA dehydrogenase [Pseudomonadota bacterium]